MNDYTAPRLAEGPRAVPIETSAPRASRAAWFALCVLLAVVILRWVDQVVLTIGMEPMRKALALSDTQLGLLQGLGLTLAAAVGSVPLAWLADRYDRRWVLAICVLFWSAATAGRGVAQSFSVVMGSTIGMSLADASLYPIAYAIIPSMFHGRQRATANLIFYTGGALGYSLALMVGGAVFAALDARAAAMPAFLAGVEPWRMASFAVAIVGPLFAALILAIRDPRHARAPQHTASRAASKAEFSDYLRGHWRALVGVYGANALVAAGLAPLLSWLPVAVARRFSLSPAEVGTQLGAVYLAATVGGLVLSAVLNRVWGSRLGDMLPARTAPWLTAVSAVPLTLLAFAGSATATFAYTFIILAALIAFNAGMPTVFQGIAPATVRARVTAGAITIGTLGGALGPIIVGYVSSRLGQNENALMMACVALGVPLTLSSAALMWWAGGPLKATLEAVRRADEAASLST